MKILKLLFLGIFTTIHWWLFCNITFTIVYTYCGIECMFDYILFHLAIGMLIILHAYFYFFTLSLVPINFQETIWKYKIGNKND